MGKKEFKIGEVFQFGLVKLKCVKSENNSCENCFLLRVCTAMKCDLRFHISAVGYCGASKRSDGQSVVFIKSED